MWSEIRFEIGEEYAETLADALLEAGALSVSVEDADAGSLDEQPLFGEPGMEPVNVGWNRSQLIVLLAPEQDAEQLLAQTCVPLQLPIPAFSSQMIAEQDWVRLTQAQFDPIQISSRLWIVPSWHEPPQQTGALILQLDPGLAFGTGSHPTTRLCLRWLEAHLQSDQSVLDYGCGSGILALAAYKLGARAIWGTDIDPQAISAAQHNNQVNQCQVQFALPDALPAEKFSVVVANILSNPLKILAPMLSHRVAPGGALVLSGVLARQAEEVIAAYAPYLPLQIWAEEEGWVCLSNVTAPASLSTQAPSC